MEYDRIADQINALPARSELEQYVHFNFVKVPFHTSHRFQGHQISGIRYCRDTRGEGAADAQRSSTSREAGTSSAGYAAYEPGRSGERPG
jgi:hypothetical protein